MPDLDNLKDLEFYFAHHFETVLFPVLAEHYLVTNDYSRAHKVLEIGLGYHPDFVEGLFIQAKTYLAEGDVKSSEKVFKKVIALDPGHYQAHVLLVQVQTELGRAPSTLRRLSKRILAINPGDKQAKAWLEKPIKRDRKARVKKPGKSGELAEVTISPQLATFTLMAVLKAQKLYDQALEVLAVMSQKEGADTERIEEERQDLLRLLKVGDGET